MSKQKYETVARMIKSRSFISEQQIVEILKEKLPPCRRGILLAIGGVGGFALGILAGVLGLIGSALNLI